MPTTPSFLQRLAVCSWSMQPTAPQILLQQLQETGLNRLQIALDPIRTEPVVWGRFADMAQKAGVTLVSGMFGTLGEDYSTLESIRRTGGIVPDKSWPDNWEIIQAAADLAQRMKLSLVSFHAGFLPHEASDPAYETMQERLRLIADYFGAKGIDLALETGQETAQTLRDFLQDLNRPNVGVNFDPANMLLYDKGNPIEALEILGPWLKQCHLKDARRTTVPGTWGEEVVLGTGEVDWCAFFQTLERLQFQGYCCIEREAGTSRVADIAAGHRHVKQLLQK